MSTMDGSSMGLRFSVLCKHPLPLVMFLLFSCTSAIRYTWMLLPMNLTWPFLVFMWWVGVRSVQNHQWRWRRPLQVSYQQQVLQDHQQVPQDQQQVHQVLNFGGSVAKETCEKKKLDSQFLRVLFLDDLYPLFVHLSIHPFGVFGVVCEPGTCCVKGPSE